MKNLFNTADCIILFNPTNIYYFSNYENSDAIILLSKNENLYITDSRYTEEVKSSIKNFNIIDGKNDLIKKAIEIINEKRYKILGYESDITYKNFQLISEQTSLEFYEITEEIEKLRSIKTDEEIQLIKKAQGITDKTFIDVLSFIKEGITEFELGCILESLLYQNGANGLSFYSIIAFGKNTSKPHAHRGNNKLKKGDFITMDFGASYKGYCSDMTRTIAFGNISYEQKTIYNRVKSAQEIALDNIRQDTTGKEAFCLVNKYFSKQNLEKYFLHSLGHGLGINIHEKPFLSNRSNDILRKNMVVSVEPGLYIAEKFGVRIEDIVIIKENGIDNLTKSEKNLIIV